jgi:hypothetical protein
VLADLAARLAQVGVSVALADQASSSSKNITINPKEILWQEQH